jgi:hypothetical protein
VTPVGPRARKARGLAALGLGLVVSCSGRPTIGITGHIVGAGGVSAGALGRTGCALELRDHNDPRRSAGIIPVRAEQWFSVKFTEREQDRIVSDGETTLELLVSCDGFTPVRRTVSRPNPMVGSFDLGLVVVRAKKE